MKKKHKIVIGCSSAIVVLCFLVLFVLPRLLFGDMIRQMKVGKVYMNSLAEKDFRTWISRSERLLSQHSGTNDISFLRDANIPPELRVLNIKRIDLLEDGVRYVWVGGFDHTCLSVYRLPEGGYRITAQYDDSHGRQLWPKEGR